jgi:hypothetical protein
MDGMQAVKPEPDRFVLTHHASRVAHHASRRWGQVKSARFLRASCMVDPPMNRALDNIFEVLSIRY